MKPYLNLGCGTRFNTSWTNVDFVSFDPAVLSHDLRTGIPFENETFEVVYHSHLLEHLPKSEALNFLRECYRVLKPGGIHRVVVPDLEGIARTYLEALSRSLEGDTEWQHNYEWILLELFDQTVREKPGGDMFRYLTQANLVNEDFVLARIGVEGKRIIDGATNQNSSSKTPSYYRVLRRLRRAPSIVRETLLRLLLRNEYQLLQKGRFRAGGEIHLWMYDRYSLPLRLKEAGFQNPRPLAATDSQIPDWAAFQLDTEPDGTTYKPDSLFVEATK